MKHEVPCKKCGAYKGTFYHKHHIIYSGEKTAILCVTCHNRITRLNTNFVEAHGYKKLNSEARLYLWNWFIQDTMIASGFSDRDLYKLGRAMRKAGVRH